MRTFSGNKTLEEGPKGVLNPALSAEKPFLTSVTTGLPLIHSQISSPEGTNLVDDCRFVINEK